jgi:hypothetical protein
MDRTSTMSSAEQSATAAVSAYPSPTQTVVDLRAILDAKTKDATDKAPSTSSRSDESATKSEYDSQARSDAHADANGFSALDASRTHETVLPPDVVLTQRKKWTLLMIFSLGFFIDIWSYSAFFVFTDPISEDLGVPLAQQSWVIVSSAIIPPHHCAVADARPRTQ